MGTINILELCRREKCTLTYISSYVYGFPQYLPVDENHPVQPANPYNHSKLMAEEMVSFYSRTFDIPTTVFRPVNIYGPGQHEEFLIPGIIRQVLDPEIETVEVMDLRPKRDYLFIDDFLEAIIATLNKPGDFYNIGSGTSYSVEEAIQSIMKSADIFKPYKDKNITRKNEIWDVYVGIEKIGRILNWQPCTSFFLGISQCVNAAKNQVR
jgi:nucleoside-diphosphate-sugar epimerase